MVEIFGKTYYIDLDGITEKCQIDVPKTSKAKSVENGPAINIFKYELIKLCIERILDEGMIADDKMGEFGTSDSTVSFKVAFNTLIKQGILIADENE
jgi:hypothetical protein